MSYTQELPPPEYDQKYVQEELNKVERAFRLMEYMRLKDTTVAPSKPRAGEVRFTSGSWDPGSGAGFYGYYGGAWVKLG